ncbi:hypothetical protein [Chitinophaga arvensicola]|uniref:Nucleotide-diphospho-sugar transferase n=1 Tax=Chitinophaga arvensicola TaxID=29529 RepID=A0A1I0S4D7_9BACT|nr:hypothetical protein [Chitinophaga arvensicola]SEW49657.1 hypothetical protein SAMN04488122_3522 [Chitinophaga arvensicola]
MLRTPVLFLIFNRPEQSLAVFEQIRRQQPEQLFIAADGPREDKPGEAALCEATRKAVMDQIDWSCSVQTLFRSRNLGCGKAVSSAIDWFFSQVTEGIILEDDCVPDHSFFPFCTTLLARYRFNDDVMHINGSNYQGGITRGEGSYYFSRYAHVWGWASWRRAWKHYDFSLRRYENLSRDGLNTFLRSELQSIYKGQTDTWDIQWFMSIWFKQGKVITPNVSLIRNIGFGEAATHTHSTPRWFKKIQYGTVSSIRHPANIRVDEAADRYSANTLYGAGGMYIRFKKIIKNNALLYNLYKRIS